MSLVEFTMQSSIESLLFSQKSLAQWCGAHSHNRSLILRGETQALVCLTLFEFFHEEQGRKGKIFPTVGNSAGSQMMPGVDLSHLIPKKAEHFRSLLFAPIQLFTLLMRTVESSLSNWSVIFFFMQIFLPWQRECQWQTATLMINYEIWPHWPSICDVKENPTVIIYVIELFTLSYFFRLKFPPKVYFFSRKYHKMWIFQNQQSRCEFSFHHRRHECG